MRAQLLTLDHLVQLMDPKLYLHLQSADSTNFFFFFRMLLVWYKREFEWADTLRLWETLWTDYLSSNFHLFIALAILEKHRDVIMEHLKHFDEVLKYSKFSASNAGSLESEFGNENILLTTTQSTSSPTRSTSNPLSSAPKLSSAASSAPSKRWIGSTISQLRMSGSGNLAQILPIPWLQPAPRPVRMPALVLVRQSRRGSERRSRKSLVMS